MKKIISVFVLFCSITSLISMEEKSCEITFHNDLDHPATINDISIKPSEDKVLVLKNGTAFAVRTQPCVTGGRTLRALPVPIIRGNAEQASCAVTLSFLIKAKKDGVYDIANEPHVIFYFSRKN